MVYRTLTKETYANNFGSNLDKYTNLALDINGYDSGMATTNNHVGNDSRYVADNTKEYQGLDKSKGDNCFGLCVGAVVLASTAIYALLEGDGDAAEGVMKIGRGDDTISKGLGKVNEAVDAAAYEVAPEFTQTVADTKQAIGGFTNEVVTYVDEKSGKRVSGTWNELSPETQDFLKGSGTILSVVLPSGALAKVTPTGAATVVGKEAEALNVPKTPKVVKSQDDIIPDSKPDFYVGSDGPANTLPSTGYRYMDSSYGERTKESMEAPLSYFGVEKYDTGVDARNAFQIFYEEGNPGSWSDARLRGEFDTLQLYDEEWGLRVRVPKEAGDKGVMLEPFTGYYPDYGQGGAQQFLPRDPVKVKFDKVDMLPEE